MKECDTKDADFLRNHGKDEPLTQAGQRCKEQLSAIPLWAQRANGNNCFWNNLASSAFNIYN
jgi:hypothetical protein